MPASQGHQLRRNRCSLKRGLMSEESNRMMTLLQELAALKKGEGAIATDPIAARKRRREIGTEMKKLAAEKDETETKALP